MKKRLINFKNSQISVEHLLLIGLIILILVPSVIIYTSNIKTDEAKAAEVVRLGNEIAEKIDEVKASGPGNWQTQTFNVPEGIKEVLVDKNEVIIKSETGTSVFFLNPNQFAFNQDTIPFKLEPGLNKIRFEYSEENFICVSTPGGSCEQVTCIDVDKDGWMKGMECGQRYFDCDDFDDSIHPCGIPQNYLDVGDPDHIPPFRNKNECDEASCDGIDDNCNGKVDENFDTDKDGFPPEYLPDSSKCYGWSLWDCDDNDINTFPGAIELCDGENNDCNEADVAPFDDDLVVPCGNETGLCTLGEKTCIVDVWDWSECDADYPGPGPEPVEICGNQEDENCDGNVDEPDYCNLLLYANFDQAPVDAEEGGGANIISYPEQEFAGYTLTPDDEGVLEKAVIIDADDELFYLAENNINTWSGTLVFWVMPIPGTNIWTDDQKHTFFSIKNTADEVAFITVFKDTDHHIYLQMFDDNGFEMETISDDVADLDPDTYHFFAVTWNKHDPSRPISFYLNEFKLGTRTISAAWDFGVLENMYVGMDYESGIGVIEQADAHIDELKIYSKAKSNSELRDDRLCEVFGSDRTCTTNECETVCVGVYEDLTEDYYCTEGYNCCLCLEEIPEDTCTAGDPPEIFQDEECNPDDKPNYCIGATGTWTGDCRGPDGDWDEAVDNCYCPGSKVCNLDTGECADACAPGVFGCLSAEYPDGGRPNYCNDGVVEPNCQVCGCPGGTPVCQLTGECTTGGGDPGCSPVIFKKDCEAFI